VKRDDLDLDARAVRIDEKVVEVRGRFEWRPPKTDSSEQVVDLPNLVIKPLAEHLLDSRRSWSLRVFSGPISLPAAIPESGS
jgi:hypothetical protein